MAASSPSECNTVGSSSYLLGNGHCMEDSYSTHVIQKGLVLEENCIKPTDNTTVSLQSLDSQQSEMDAADTVIVRPALTVRESVCSDKSISTTSAPAWCEEEEGESSVLIANALTATIVKDSKYSESNCDFDDSDVGDEDFDAVAQDFQTEGSAQDDFASYEAAISRDDSLVRIYTASEDRAPADLYILEDSEDFTIKTKIPSPQVLDTGFSARQTEPPDRSHYLVEEVGSDLGILPVLELTKVCGGNTAERKESEETGGGDVIKYVGDELCNGDAAEHRKNEEACDEDIVECKGDKEMCAWNTAVQKEDEENSFGEEDSLYFEYLSDDAVSVASKISAAEISAVDGATVTAADNNGREPLGQLDSIPSDEEDFYDALDHQVEKEFDVALPHSKDKHHRRTASDLSMESYANDLSSESESEGSVNEARVYTTKANSPKKGLQRQGSGKRDHRRTGSQDKIRMPRSATDNQTAGDGTMVPRRQRRKWIPEKPSISLNLWSVMKNCIGKELSKIPMPVNFSEPLSMLQRLTEELEYSEILDQAALCDDSCEQLAYVAAFTVSAYATTLFRTAKPFNPLLGETFEFDRTDDFGWRSLAEQVSHHPPTLATHTEGRGWTLWQEFTMTTKFRGRYLQIIPMGIAHLTFTKSGGHYTWRKVTTTVHNIIVGRLWVDNQGEMDITNHTTGDRCHLKYSAYSYFSRESPRKVSGVVTDSKDNARWVLTGNWCTKMEGAPIIHVEESNKGKPVFETGPHKLLWKVRPPPNGAERIYFFSQLAIEMNEPEEGVAPTDSRNRPDQRLMEEGKWDEANHMKILLEEKQRGTRRHRETEMEKARNEGKEVKPYTPTWFRKELDPITGNLMHVFTHKYWDCKTKQHWDLCPSIFL